jgi:hypothetical protein
LPADKRLDRRYLTMPHVERGMVVGCSAVLLIRRMPVTRLLQRLRCAGSVSISCGGW